jgi:putative pyruvate formate lyase activating enzyme
MQHWAQIEAARRAQTAQAALHSCELCPRACKVNRTEGQKGYCRLDERVCCFRQMVYDGEEYLLNPSHQIYFSGCNLRCGFCSVAEWNVEPMVVEPLNMDFLIAEISRRRHQGAKTLNLLGGEPAVNLYGILELLGRLDPAIIVVWNSNMYYNDIVDELIRGLVDIFLADFKCGNVDCAGRMLDANGYLDTVKRNILKAKQYADVIVRHVVLPGHLDCCLKPILYWLADNMPDVKLSLRFDYVPPADAVDVPDRYLEKQEAQAAVKMARALRLNLIQ